MACKDKEKEKQRHREYNKTHKKEIRTYQKRYYQSHKEELKPYHREYYLNHKESESDHSKSLRPKKYGLTPDEYSDLLKSHDGVCAICGKQETAKAYKTDNIRQLSIDHDHTTGKVRGLLCSKCNLMVSHADDSPSILRKAADYLERPSFQV